jgi:hypothetical protein
MPPELNSEEIYREAKKMKGQLLEAVDQLNEFAQALAKLSVEQEPGEDSE